jgi:hypothetical protein
MTARDYLEDGGVDGTIILRRIFRIGMWGYELDRSGIWVRTALFMFKP